MKHVVRQSALTLAIAGALFATSPAHSGAYVFAGDANGLDVVAHPSGYTGTGGVITVDVCIAPGTTNAADMVVSVQNIVDRFNLFVETRGNVKTGVNNDIASSAIDFESVAVHEVGHCIGLAHPNAASESGLTGANANYTKAEEGTNAVLDINAGADGVIGSADDVRGDDVNLHWFEIGVNDPFDGPTTPDSANYSRDVADLPVGELFPANGDRSVSVLMGYPTTEAVMQQGSGFDEDQRSLTSDDVVTLKHARAGLDQTAGNANDYTVVLNYGGIASGCDVNLAFDNNETGFAVCQLGGTFISGDDVRITSANSFYNTGFTWNFADERIPLPASDTIEVSAGGSTSALANGDDSLLDNDVDQENVVDDLVADTTPTISPTAGNVTIATDGTFTYTHTDLGETSDSFVYEVCIDGSFTCSHQKAFITVVSNGAPQPGTDSITIAEGGTATLLVGGSNTVLNNDTDPEGDDLAVTTTPIDTPDRGNVSLATTGTFSYTHDGTENFSDSFIYEVCDDGSPVECANGTVNITISEVNESPVASNETLSDIGEDSGQRIIAFSALTSNDSAGTGENGSQTLTVTSVSSPVGGAASIVGSTVRFSPTTDYSGPASFNYVIQDNGTTNGVADPLSDSATASFDIFESNDAPIVSGESLSDRAEDSGAFDTTFAALLSNDEPGPSNESGQSITITNVSSAVGGSANIVGNAVRFTPTADFVGAASLSYTVTDDGTTDGVADPQSVTATATFTITEVNDPPVTDGDSLASVDEDSGARNISTSALLANDSAGPANESGQSISVINVTGATGGTVTLDGSTVTFTPADEFFGSAGFDYTIEDDGTTNGASDALTATGSVLFDIDQVNDVPIVSGESLSDRAEDSGAFDTTFAALLSNDEPGPSNESGQSLTVTNVSSAVGGSANIVGNAVRFTPTANFVGAASFSYTVTDDGTAGGAADPQSAVASATFTVTEVNDAPVADGDSLASVDEDSGARDIPTSALLANDSAGPANESGQSISVINVTGATGGTATLDGSTVTFTPADEFFGSAGFDYAVEDDGTTNGASDALTDTASVSFEINDVNDAPTANGDSLPNAAEDSPPLRVAISDLTDNDATGPLAESAQSLTLLSVQDEVGGSAAIDGSEVVFTLLENFSGAASFGYTVEDDGTTNGVADPLAASAVVAVSVSEVNDAPVAQDDMLDEELAPGETATIDAATLLADDTPGPDNESGQQLNLIAVGNPFGGAVELDNQTISFVIDDDFEGLAGFDYTIEDDGQSDGVADPQAAIGRVSVRVGLSNSGPVAKSDIITVVTGETTSRLQDGRDNLLSNDTEVNGENLVIATEPVSLPQSGTATIETDGSFTYSHDGGAAQFDFFEYEVCDDATPSNCSVARVTVAISSSQIAECSADVRRASVGEPLLISTQDAFSAFAQDYDATGLPASLNLEPNSGVIGGVPTSEDIAGSPYEIEVSTVDGSGVMTANLQLVIEDQVDAFFSGSFENFCNPQ